MKELLIVLAALAFCVFTKSQDRTEYHVLNSEHLSESRAINISLPPNYHSNNKTYPVLYVLDGEYAFDYATGSVQFLANDFNYLPEMIVVGIPNTDRLRDFYVTFEEDGEYISFINFLEHEVFLFLSENYRVNDFRVLYGWSSAAGICSYIMVKRPALVDGYIMTGFGIGPKTEKFIKENLPDKFDKRKYMYANVEGEEPRKSGLLRYRQLLSDMDPKNMDWKCEIEEHSDHVDAMAQGIYSGLKHIFSEFYPPNEIKTGGYQAFLNYYDKIKPDYWDDLYIPVGAINETAWLFLDKDLSQDAIDLLKYGISVHPESATLCGSLAELYQIQSNVPMAKKYFKKAINNSSDSPADYLKYEVLLRGLGE